MSAVRSGLAWERRPSLDAPSRMKSLPNILTGSRLFMALFMFVAFAAAAGAGERTVEATN